MSTTPDRLWHARSEVQVCQVLETRPETGLSASEVTDRLRRSGPNEMTERAGTPGWKKFLLQFHQVLVYVLLVAAAKAALLGEYVDAGV
ncbi:MAG: cation-transporting P-type ATPase, partial [Verrucomicrobiota bacterium]